MRIFKIIIAGSLGLALGLGLWKFEDSGYTQQWEKLSTPPQVVSELIPAGEPPLYIKTSDGKTYRYSDWHNQGWIEESIPEKLMNPFDVTKPCKFSSAEFSFFSNAPKDIKDCVQEKTMYADGYIMSTFVIDNKGNIWRWHHARTPDDIISLFCLLSSGLLIGLVVGFALVNAKNIKEKR